MFFFVLMILSSFRLSLTLLNTMAHSTEYNMELPKRKLQWLSLENGGYSGCRWKMGVVGILWLKAANLAYPPSGCFCLLPLETMEEYLPLIKVCGGGMANINYLDPSKSRFVEIGYD